LRGGRHGEIHHRHRAIFCSRPRVNPCRINQSFNALRKLVEWRIGNVIHTLSLLNPSQQGD
jgi:hypothetical protein